MATTPPDRSFDGLQRVIVVVLAIIALLFIVQGALGWSPGGIMTDAKGAPILDHGNPIPRPRDVGAVIAIIAVGATLVGTVLGMYFGFSAGARTSQVALAVAVQAKQTADLVNQATQNANASVTAANARVTAAEATAASATARATAAEAAGASATARATAAEQLKADAGAALVPLLAAIERAKPHVLAADAALGAELDARAQAAKQAMS